MPKVYTHFRYIAYQVPTVTKTNIGQTQYRIPPGKGKNLQNLKGEKLSELGDDALARVATFIEVLRLAREKISSDDNDTTLKIFMGPEFYFRPDRENRSYTVKEYRAIKDVLRTSIAAFRHQKFITSTSPANTTAIIVPDFEDWLIIPGTIMWESDEELVGWRPDMIREKKVYFNTGLYIRQTKGSEKLKGEKDSRIIEKAFASNIDGIPTGLHEMPPNPTAESDNKSSSDALKDDLVQENYYQTEEKIQKHLFKVSGVKFGLEICLEHGANTKVLRKHLVKNLPDKSNAVDIHLLTAGGMHINEESVVARKGGYILRNDGYVPQPNSSETNCKKIDGYPEAKQGKGPNLLQINFEGEYPKDLASFAGLDDITQGKFHSFLPGNPNQQLHIDSPAGCENAWANHQQGLAIYSKQEISYPTLAKSKL